MTETEPTNWQIRINVFGTTEEAYAAHDTIANAMGRERFNDIRLVNIDKDEGEIDDETQILCKSCGRLDGALHSYVCDACLILEKAERQREEDANKHPITHGQVPYCTACGTIAKLQDSKYWYCPNEACANNCRINGIDDIHFTT